MVDLVLPFITNKSEILDPSAGDGIFIKALIDRGVNTSQITGHDINSEKIQSLLELGIHARCTDTLLEDYPLKDIIIGNPPYKSRRKSIYMKINRKELEKRYYFIGLYNLYSLFIVNAIQHMKSKGILCFIVEDAFFTNRYYRRFREFILNNTYILEIKLAPWRLFHRSQADVRTAILTLKKKDQENYQEYHGDKKHIMRLIDRLASEKEYKNPPKVQNVPQIEYRKMPDHKFFVGVPLSIIRLIQNPPARFGDIAKGGTGISTGNDDKYLRPALEVESDPESWVGFYKSGQRTPYYYKTPYFIEKNYQKNAEADPKNFLVRNEQFYFKEGITCSSVGRKFSAAYLPPGNLFGVNANFFFDNEDDLYYSLGYLNSKLVQYLARKVIHRSNIIATSFLKEMPFRTPSIEQKSEVIAIVKDIINSLKNNPNYNFVPEAERIDEIIFNLYGISNKLKREITGFCEKIIDFA
ncbi:MAG: Eco57I restriction-modification methylase domain-containing protein [Candidatus Heimdallarchaeota archaeon]|nr:MAG: Eco57I restriction-modification methylase domain-containing protein [Candidatus Heimdallarchaeota archaeon]